MRIWVSALDTNNNRSDLKCVAIPLFIHTNPWRELFIESWEESVYFLLKQVHGLYRVIEKDGRDLKPL